MTPQGYENTTRKRRLRITGGSIVLALVVLVVLALIGRPWIESMTIRGLNLTVTNDTHHAITWKCGTGDRSMQPGETDVLRFAIQPEDTSGCDYANNVEMCVNEYKPNPAMPVTASYAINEWACK
ncbi:hypothetical protein [Leifsonia sp. P73]|uniref:hypothetical protein n=1 Tax=Leifsonia sp. P73 TaxID=3423959 RepID=UPI003DA56772